MPSPPTKPNDLEMFLPDFRASIRIGNFVNSKHPVLSTIIGKAESLYIKYTSAQFVELLGSILTTPDVSGLRIYFASYQKLPLTVIPSQNNRLIPIGMEDTLTLIFAPTHQVGTIHKDTGDYYILDLSGNVINLTTATDDPKIAKRWVSHYFTLKCRLLTEILNLGNAPGDPQKMETQSLFYKLDNIKQLHEFLIDPLSIDLPVAIFAFFGAYHLKEYSEHIPNLDYAGKLTLVFGFMNVYKEIFYYYQNKDEYDRDRNKTITNAWETVKDQFKEGSEDTGVPCPPPECEGADLSNNNE